MWWLHIDLKMQFLITPEKFVTSFWPSMVSDKKSAVIQTFFLWLLSSFFFVFSFQKFNYDFSWHEFLWVYLVWGLLSFLNL